MEKKYPRVGVGVMIQNEKGEVLMGLRLAPIPDEWCFPGGSLEFGENIEKATIREAEEETGLKVSNLELIAVVEEKRYIIINNKHYIVIGFRAGKYSGEPRLMEPDKFREWKWFSLDNLPDKMLEATELIIKNYKAGKIYQG
ncbi:MAG: NUDIX domain-containing protein [Patescibacteria group bacterium]